MNTNIIFKKSAINLGVKVSAQLLNLALIPIYILYLKTSEYGVLNIGFVFLNFFILLAAFGMSDSLVRFYSKVKSERLKKLVLSNILFFITFLTVVLFLIILPFQENLALALFDDPYLASFLLLIIVLGIFETWNHILVMLLQVEGENILYGKFFIIKNIVKVLLTYILLKYYNLNLTGAIIGLLVSSFLFILLCFPLIKSRISFKFSQKVFRILIKYGWPFVISSYALVTLFQVDQIILKFLIGLEAVAIYGLSYKIGSAIQYLNTSFSMAWFPHLFSLKDEKAKDTIYDMLGYYLSLIFIMGILLTLANNFYLSYLLPNDYLMAVEIIPWIMWGYIIFGLSDFLGAGLFMKYKTLTHASIAGISALINIGLNLILVPRYGIKAAAIVTFVSLIFFTLVSFAIAQRHFNLTLPYAKYFKIILPNIILIYLSFIVLSESIYINTLYMIFIIALAIAIPLSLKILSWQNVKKLFSFN
jgi:O-antigen/teichoic acid export membrane protein